MPDNVPTVSAEDRKIVDDWYSLSQYDTVMYKKDKDRLCEAFAAHREAAYKEGYVAGLLARETEKEKP